jgi:molybdopterin converting factor small subunit
VSVDAASIGALLTAISAEHPGLGKPLLDENGAPRRFVNLFLNGEDIRFLQGVETPLKEGDEVSIVPAIAGGVSGVETYNLTFNRGMFETPILYNIGKRFRVVTTIRRAILNEEGGWAEVAFSGSSEEIGRALAELQTTGVNTTGPLSDLVEAGRDYRPVSIGRGT